MTNKYLIFSIILTYICLIGCNEDEISGTEDCNSTASGIHPKAMIYQSVIDKYTAKGLPGISILIRDNKGTWVGASGKADIDADIKMKPCIISKGASTTKTFIGTLVVLLAQEGKLSLDEQVEKWISQEVSSKVKNIKESTIRMLLNHTTGIFDLIDDDQFYLAVLNNPPHFWKPEELITFVFGDEPVFAAGTDVEYSNTNYLLLAMILDKVTGNDHSIAIRKKLLEPLNLNNSFYYWHDALPTKVAQGYFDFYNNGTLVNISNYNTGSGNGYGGMYTTVYDLQTFIEALLRNKKIINQQSLNEMMTFTKIDDGYNRANGLGIFKDYLERAPDQFGLGHRGRDLGYTADMYWFPVQDYTLTYLINYGTDANSSLRPVFFRIQKGSC